MDGDERRLFFPCQLCIKLGANIKETGCLKKKNIQVNYEELSKRQDKKNSKQYALIKIKCTQQNEK